MRPYLSYEIIEKAPAPGCSLRFAAVGEKQGAGAPDCAAERLPRRQCIPARVYRLQAEAERGNGADRVP